MRHLNLVCFVLLSAALITLSACGNGNYGKRPQQPWQYKTAQAPAQAAPNTITSPDITNTAAPQSQGRDAIIMEGMQDTAQAPAQMPDNTNLELPSVKVGLLLPLSGDNAHLGDAMLKAAQMALFDLGYNGLELLPRDTKGTREGGRDAAQSAIQDGAQLILGPVFADAVSGARSVAQSKNVSLIAFSTDWKLAGGNTFIMGFLPFDQIERVVSYAAMHGVRNVGVLSPQTDYGKAVLSAYRNAAAKNNVNTISSVAVSPSNANLSPTVRSFTRYDERMGASSTGAYAQTPMPYDAVLLPVGGETARSLGSLLSQFDAPPRSVRRIGTGLWDDPALASEPSLAGGWFAAPSPKNRGSFVSRYNNLYRSSPPRLASLAYDATALAAVLARTGLQQNGRPSFDRASISNPNGFNGVDGIFRFRGDGIAERGLAVLEFKNGQAVVIDDAPRTFQQAPSGSSY